MAFRVRVLLGHKLLLLITGSIFVVTTLLMFATWATLKSARSQIERDGHNILADQTEQLLTSLVGQHTRTLDMQLSYAQSTAAHAGLFLSQRLRAGALDPSSIDSFLLTLQQRLGGSASVYVVSNAGELRCGSVCDERIDREKIAQIISRRAEGAPLSALRAGDTLWGSVHASPLSPTYDLVVDVMSPIVDDRQAPWGLVLVPVSLSSLIVQFNRNPPIRSSYTFLMDKNMQLVAAPPQGRVELASPEVYRPRGLIDLEHTSNEALKAALREMSLGASGIRTVEIQGDRKYIAYQPMSTVDWRMGVVVSVPLATAASAQLASVVGQASDRALGRMLLSAALAAVLALVAGVLLTRRLVRPLSEMSLVSASIVEGRYDRRVTVRSTDEIGTLGNAFNAMAANVQELVDSLARRADELRKANDALQRQTSILELVLFSMGDAVVVADAEGQVILWNPEAERIYGKKLKGTKKQARSLAEGCFLPDQTTEIPTQEVPIVRAIRGEPVDQVELLMKNVMASDGDREGIWLSVTARPLLSEDGELRGGVAVVRDISSRKRAEEALQRAHDDLERRVEERAAELREAQRRLVDAAHQAGMAEVATSVLHNVGNVLNSVNVAAAVVTDRLKGSRLVRLNEVAAMLRSHKDDLASFLTTDERGRLLPSYIEKLAEQFVAEREAMQSGLSSLTDNIDHIRHIIMMQQGYARRPKFSEMVDPAEVVEDAVRFNAAGLERHGIDVVREYGNVKPVLLEKHRVLQICVNLVSNAKYALAESTAIPKRITLRISATERDRLKIDVCDNGCGIPLQNMSQLFRYGFTTRDTGHGFGLHSSALAAKEMGGDLRAHSDGSGKGSVFTLELPMITERPAHECVPSAEK